VADPIATNAGFGSDLVLPVVSKGTAEVLGYWDYGGRGELLVRKSDILNVAKKYVTATQLKWMNDKMDSGASLLSGLIVADTAAVIPIGLYSPAYWLIRLSIGSNYDKAFQNSVNAAK
jgi:hypothetical protein